MFWWWGVLSLYTNHSVTLLYLSFSCSPCYYCVLCSCVRPGIQCGLSVRGTFRVSQTVPAPCAPSHCLASCCGCLWGLLQPANIPITSSSKSERITHFLSASWHYWLFAWCCSSTDTAWLKDFPECTTLRSHCRRRRLPGSILKPPLLSFPIPSPMPADIPPSSNAPATGIGGPQVTPTLPLAGSSLFL